MNRIFVVAALLAGFCQAPASAQSPRPSLMDSFPIGSGGGALCQAQSKSSDVALTNMFDRTWTLVCRDAATPVAQLFALRGDTLDSDTRIISAQKCTDWVPANLVDLAGVSRADCDVALQSTVIDRANSFTMHEV